MATTIYPSDNDIAPVAGDGRLGSETNMRRLLDAMLTRNHVVNGLDVTGTSTISVASGEAIIEGQRVLTSAALTAPSLTTDATHYLYLTIARTSSKATGTALFWTTTVPTDFLDGVLLASVVRTGGVNATPTDLRVGPARSAVSVYTGNGDAATGQSFTVIGTGTPSLVVVASADPDVWAVGMPRRRDTGAYSGAGVCVRGVAGTGPLRPQVLTGSTTWDPGLLGSGDEATINVTVTGAAVGQPASAALTTAISSTNWAIRAMVTAADTVEVVLRRMAATSENLASGTVVVYVTTSATVAERAEIVEANDGILTPKLISGGFQVKDVGGGGLSLNQNTKVYSYIVIF